MRRVRGIGRRFSDTVLGGLPSVRPINFELIAFANDLACIEASISLIPSHPLFPFLLKRGASFDPPSLPPPDLELVEQRAFNTIALVLKRLPLLRFIFRKIARIEMREKGASTRNEVLDLHRHAAAGG